MGASRADLGGGKPSELPPLTPMRLADTHRLIPSKYRDGGESVLARIADSDAHLRDIFDLDNATNDRLLAEDGRFPGVGPYDLVFAPIPHYRIINAAFTHPHPLGSRFNGPDRGAWYAGRELETAQAEVVFHKTTEYAEIGRFRDSVTYDDYLADFGAEFHDLRGDARFAAALDPVTYAASQQLAERLLAAGSAGVLYPSVRRPGGLCLACFQPALVGHVRRAATYRFTWDGEAKPRIDVEATLVLDRGGDAGDRPA